jgi:hypothetical protein
MRTKQEYLSEIPFEYIIGFSEETGLIRDHSCFTKKDFVFRLARTLSSEECCFLNKMFINNMPYKCCVSWYLDKYPTGDMLGKDFVEYLHKQKSNLGSICFEFPIDKTRVDILRLDTEFHAYEVKSKRDKFDRLNYQIPALQKVFDFVYLIVSYEQRLKALNIIDSNTGLITFSSDTDTLAFSLEREPKLNCNTNPINQLKLLRIDELLCIARTNIKKPKILTRNGLITTILQSYNREQIQELFKSTIRKRTLTDINKKLTTNLNLNRFLS